MQQGHLQSRCIDRCTIKLLLEVVLAKYSTYYPEGNVLIITRQILAHTHTI